MEFNIKRLTEFDYPVIKKMYRECFNLKVQMSEIERLFSQAIGYIAFTNSGDPAAYYGVFRWDLYGDRAAQSGATMTRVKYRGRGLFTTLANRCYEACKEEGIEYVFGFPNENSYPGFVKLRWKWHGNMWKFTIKNKVFPLVELLSMNSVTRNWYKNYWGCIPGIKVDTHLLIGENMPIESMTDLAKTIKAGKTIVMVNTFHPLYRTMKDYPKERSLPIGYFPITKDMPKDIPLSQLNFDTW